MKSIYKFIVGMIIAVSSLVSAPSAYSWDYLRMLGGAFKAVEAVTISDEQIRGYVKDYVQYSDKKNQLLPPSDPYSRRLAEITKGLTSVDGVPLNFKVYKTNQVNAFACADGSVRVYSGLMDIMTDDEILGVVGHEIGHVAHKDTKKAFKTALMTSALRDGIASGGGLVGALTDSQLGTLGESVLNAKYSQKQEQNADDYGYDFLKSHGKNPAAMALAFRKLKSLEEKSGSGSSMAKSLFSDHPSTDKRIKRMEKRAKKDGYVVPEATTKS